MALQLILGRAGTGKTHTCWEEIKQELAKEENPSPLILLVPEQATFQNERALASMMPGGGIIQVQVLSFQRLAYRVLQEVGGCARIHIDELGKKMILRGLLEQHKDKLKLFSRGVEQPGFVDSLSQILKELKNYCIEPGHLEKFLAGDSASDQNILHAKLHDLHLIYHALEEYLMSQYLDPDGYLLLLAEHLEESQMLAGAKIWLDGFSGFTPVEYRVLEKILQKAQQVKITLCLDPEQQGSLEETELFYITRETRLKLEALAAQAGVELEPPLVLKDPCPPRFREAPPLAHLERYFFQRPAPAFLDEPAGLELVAAANRRAEVEAVARKILYLCREQGYRFRDVSVILRDLEPYEPLIRTVFADYHIPFFIDQKRSVMHHPLVELIRSALEVLKENWAYEPVFRYLKTDLVPISRKQVDLLENYVLAHGLRGTKLWTQEEPWTYRRQYALEDEEPEITPWEEQELHLVNAARQLATQHLVTFKERLKKSKTVRQKAEALFSFLTDLEVPQKLEIWSNEAQARGRLEEAQEHAQVWNGLMALLDQMVEAMGEEELSLENFSQILDSGLESLRLGLIPPGLDQVLISNLERSRNPNVRGAFVLGLNDGVFPMRLKDEGLLSEKEREGLQQKGLELAPGSKRRLFDEQFLLYQALTRAGEYLWLSYPLADEEGKALMPSVAVGRVKELFPALEEKSCTLDPHPEGADPLEYVSHTDRTLAYLAAQLREAKAGREISPLWWQVYNYYVQEPSLREKTQGVLAGLFHVNNEQPIQPAISKKLYGQPYRSSVSRLERFAACPFQHFLSYGLKLKEREIYKLEAPDLGQFFHAALKLFGERIQERGLDWGSLNAAECGQLTWEVVEELAPKLQNQILMSTARHRYLKGRLRRTLQRAALVLREHARRGSFRPVALELDFGPQGKLPPLEVDLGNGMVMELTGRIDRVDLARCGDKNYLRVIDYKSSTSDLALSDLFHGLKLQLLAYLDVVLTFCEHLAAQGALPAGILYFSVMDPLIKASGPKSLEDVEKEILKKLKMRGYVVADTQVVQEMDREISGSSHLIPAGITKKGTLHAKSSVFTYEQFDLLRHHLRATLKELGQGILNGTVNISPYQKKGFKPCQYCQYKAVCHFDPLLEENTYRILSEDKAEEIWLKIKEKGGAISG